MFSMEIFRNEKDVQTYSAGEALVEEGAPGDAMFVVLDGQVEITRQGKVLEQVGPGGVFGEMALIDQAPRNATARALTDCTVARIDKKRFMFLVQQTPFFSLEVMRVMANRIRAMSAMM